MGMTTVYKKQCPQAHEVFYPDNPYMPVQCKDIGSYLTWSSYRCPVGTLVWKVSWILIHLETVC